jgi:hypothetical protein
MTSRLVMHPCMVSVSCMRDADERTRNTRCGLCQLGVARCKCCGEWVTRGTPCAGSSSILEAQRGLCSRNRRRDGPAHPSAYSLPASGPGEAPVRSGTDHLLRAGRLLSLRRRHILASREPRTRCRPSRPRASKLGRALAAPRQRTTAVSRPIPNGEGETLLRRADSFAVRSVERLHPYRGAANARRQGRSLEAEAMLTQIRARDLKRYGPELTSEYR